MVENKKEHKHSMYPDGYCCTNKYAFCIVELKCGDCDFRTWDWGEVNGSMYGTED